MEQRYTFIKTNEIKDDTMSEEERVCLLYTSPSPRD